MNSLSFFFKFSPISNGELSCMSVLTWLEAQTLLLRFVVDLLCNKSTTNRSNGIWALTVLTMLVDFNLQRRDVTPRKAEKRLTDFRCGRSRWIQRALGRKGATTRHNTVSHPSFCGRLSTRRGISDAWPSARHCRCSCSSIDRVKVSCQHSVTHVLASSASRRKRQTHRLPSRRHRINFRRRRYKRQHAP